jgi:hypothetical protein
LRQPPRGPADAVQARWRAAPRGIAERCDETAGGEPQTCFTCRRRPPGRQPLHVNGAAPMSKGMDQKKNEKKKPEKTLKEKRAAKKEKKK